MADETKGQMPFYPEIDAKQQLYLPQRQATPLEEAFRTVRLGISEVISSVNDFVQIGKSHTETTLEQLQEQHLELQKEENLPARLAIIGGLGALGLMIGAVRGRRLKRMFYTSVGAGVGTVVCYPQETRDTFTNLRANISAGELPHVSLDSISVIDMGQITQAAQSAFEKCSELATSIFNQAKSLSQTTSESNQEVMKDFT